MRRTPRTWRDHSCSDFAARAKPQAAPKRSGRIRRPPCRPRRAPPFCSRPCRALPGAAQCLCHSCPARRARGSNVPHCTQDARARSCLQSNAQCIAHRAHGTNRRADRRNSFSKATSRRPCTQGEFPRSARHVHTTKSADRASARRCRLLPCARRPRRAMAASRRVGQPNGYRYRCRILSCRNAARQSPAHRRKIPRACCRNTLHSGRNAARTRLQ